MSTLVIQLERLGDLVQTTPALQALQAGGETEVDILVSSGHESFLVGLPGLRNIYPIPRDLQLQMERDLRAGRAGSAGPEAVLDALQLPVYDRVCNFTHHRFGSRLAALVDARRHSGPLFDGEGRWRYAGWWHQYPVALLDFRAANRFNLVDLYRASVGGSAATLGEARPMISGWEAGAAGELPDGVRVALNPGASRDWKRWPRDRYARLAGLIADSGAVPVLVGGPDDEALCAGIEAVEPRAVNRCGGSIEALADLLARCELLVSNDTGAAHVAAAVGTPVIALFGATHFAETAPWGDGHWILQVPFSHESADWTPLTPELVAEAVARRLEDSDAEGLALSAQGAGILLSETRVDREGDPVGGLVYRRFGASATSAEEAQARLLRRLFACVLTPGEAIPKTGDIGCHEPELLRQRADEAAHWCERVAPLLPSCQAAMQAVRARDRESLREASATLSGELDALLDAAREGGASAAPLILALWHLKTLGETHPDRVFLAHLDVLQRAIGWQRQLADLLRLVADQSI